MTLLHFTFGALPYHDPDKGTHIIHCWIAQSEMTQTDDPGAERRAAKDARHILDDILLRNINTDEERNRAHLKWCSWAHIHFESCFNCPCHKRHETKPVVSCKRYWLDMEDEKETALAHECASTGL